MEVAVLQKVEPKILGSLKLHVEDDLSAEVLQIWKALIRAENSVVNLDNCPSLSAFCRSLLSIYLTMYLHVHVCQKIWGHNYLLSYVCANVL